MNTKGPGGLGCMTCLPEADSGKTVSGNNESTVPRAVFHKRQASKLYRTNYISSRTREKYPTLREVFLHFLSSRIDQSTNHTYAESRQNIDFVRINQIFRGL